MALDPDVVVVAPMELITADHMNDIRANLDRLDTDKSDKANPVFTGAVQVGGDPFTTDEGIWMGNGRIVQETNDASTTAASFATTGTGGIGVDIQLTGAASVVGGIFARFANNSGVVGSIVVSGAGTGVVYNTTSDPRLKHVDDADGTATAVAAIRQLGPAVFLGRWLDPASGDPVGLAEVMVSSHDVEDAAPWAVTGERGAVDTDGRPSPQQVNYMALVPALVAALADALARIEALEGGTP